MNGYLVIANCPMDDVPMSLHATIRDAKKAKRKYTLDDVKKTALVSDISEVYGFDIWEFKDGKPV